MLHLILEFKETTVITHLAAASFSSASRPRPSTSATSWRRSDAPAASSDAACLLAAACSMRGCEAGGLQTYPAEGCSGGHSRRATHCKRKSEHTNTHTIAHIPVTFPAPGPAVRSWSPGPGKPPPQTLCMMCVDCVCAGMYNNVSALYTITCQLACARCGVHATVSFQTSSDTVYDACVFRVCTVPYGVIKRQPSI